MNLYELATCGEDCDLWKWIDHASYNQLRMLVGFVHNHENCDEKRMHMLFVWWATQ